MPRAEASEPQPPPNSLNAGRRSPALFAALLVAFAIGGGVTAAALQVRRPAIVMLTPAPITSMHDWSEVQHLSFDKFVSPDGLHMNDWGYACMAKLLADGITEAANRPIASVAAQRSR